MLLQRCKNKAIFANEKNVIVNVLKGKNNPLDISPIPLHIDYIFGSVIINKNY
jgi:hypothetical protein